jgi:hypothetical protein
VISSSSASVRSCAKAIDVPVQVLDLETRRVVAEVPLTELAHGAREEAVSEQSPRDDPDAELARQRHELVLRVARPERPFHLHGGDRVDGVRAPELLGRDVRNPEVSHLSLVRELSHFADCFLDWHARIRKVQVPKIASSPRRRRLASAASRARSGRASIQISLA